MDLPKLREISENFLSELKQASSGHKTSLPFIVHKLPDKSPVREGDRFEVLTLGGSVFKKAGVRKMRQGVKILKITKGKIGLMKSKQDLLSFVAANLDRDIDILVFNFAYAMEPVFRNDGLDGKFVASAKGHTFGGLYGKLVGREIENYIQKKFGRRIQVTVANDTICLLLSGLAKFHHESLVGGVVGTGMNFAFLIDQDHAVNLESGSFDKFNQTESGKKLDIGTAKRFEQEVSGAYLHRHFNLMVKAEKFKYPLIDDSLRLSEIASQKIGRVSKVAREILERSAQFAACQIAGIVRFKARDLVFVMEGSLFWDGYKYRQTIENTVKALVPSFGVRFAKIENSDVLGAARLVSLI